MDQHPFFKWIARINSILFLLLLLAAVGLISFGYFQANKWDAERAVEVKTDSELSKSDMDLRLGDIHSVSGHADIQYMELRSTSRPKGLGSSSVGYGGGQIRNVMYLVGPELDTHWLYDTNKYFIEDIDQLKAKGYECDASAIAAAILYKVIKADSNNDGKLSGQDLMTVSLTKPDGTGYVELGNFDAVIDHETDAEGEYLTLVVQKGDDVLAWKYALNEFKKVSEKKLTTID